MTHPTRNLRARRVALPLLLWPLLLGLLGATVWLDNSFNRGITYRPDPRPVPWTDGPPLGVNAYNIQFEADPAKVTRTLELARDLGAGYVRLQMPWDDVEIHAKGDFEDRRNPQHIRSAWEKYDFIIGEARRLGLEPIVRIDRAPDWSRPQALASELWREGVARNANATGPPDRYADYADFAGAAAARYRGKVRFFQIWNEPNLAYEWNWQRPDPARFVELLRAASQAVKRASPDAAVLFPSLAPTDGLEASAPLTDLEYLDQVYRAGGGDAFDILSAQAYGLGQPPDEHRYIRVRRPANWSWRQPVDTRIDVSRLPLLREVMERHGDTGKPVWISEFGYNSAPEGVPGRDMWGAPVSEEQKGVYLVGQLERARREWPWVGVMCVWFLRWGGEAPNPDDPTPYFALADRDFRPLPAYTALQQYLAARPPAGVGAHVWSHPAVERRPEGWALRFEGSALALGGSGAASVSIDGGAPVAVTLAGAQTPVTVAQGLADAPHTALVQAPAAPELFVVGRAPPLAWLWTLAPALLIAGLVCAAALAARGLAG